MVIHRGIHRVNAYQLHTKSMLELISDWFVAPV